MGIVLLSRDLATSSRVEGAAVRQKATLRTVGTAEQTAAECSDGNVSLVIVDLTLSGIDLPSLVAALKGLPLPPKVLAFGPHVHESALAAAKDAGCDAVLSRGKFFAELDEIVRLAVGAA